MDVDPRLPDGITTPLTLTWTLSNREVLTTPVDFVGLDQQLQARFYWAWQVPTTAETISLTFTLLLPPDLYDPDPADNTLVVSFTPRSAEAFQEPEPETRWTFTEMPGFRLHYLTDTAAERDLSVIMAEAAGAYVDVTAEISPTETLLDIYFLDRVIGQGGYASSGWVAISYTDRQYTPVNLGLVLRHELTHRMDVSLGCNATPSLVREGLAVYVAGGHYVQESIVHAAAVIRASEHYIPLSDLGDDFYAHQHEISYMEAGAFVTYLVDQFGWSGLAAFCQAAAWNENVAGDVPLLDAGLQALGEKSLQAFQTKWEMWLAEQSVMSTEIEKLATELHLMETLRTYQSAYDFSAHFLEGILFSPQEGEHLNITADFVRRPREAEPVILELLLVMAREALEREDTVSAEGLLVTVDDVLSGGFPDAGLAADVRAIVVASLAQDYEPYRLVVRDSGQYEVQVLDYTAWPEQRVLVATLTGAAWSVTESLFSD